MAQPHGPPGSPSFEAERARRLAEANARALASIEARRDGSGGLRRVTPETDPNERTLEELTSHRRREKPEKRGDGDAPDAEDNQGQPTSPGRRTARATDDISLQEGYSASEWERKKRDEGDGEGDEDDEGEGEEEEEEEEEKEKEKEKAEAALLPQQLAVVSAQIAKATQRGDHAQALRLSQTKARLVRRIAAKQDIAAARGPKEPDVIPADFGLSSNQDQRSIAIGPDARPIPDQTDPTELTPQAAAAQAAYLNAFDAYFAGTGPHPGEPPAGLVPATDRSAGEPSPQERTDVSASRPIPNQTDPTELTPQDAFAQAKADQAVKAAQAKADQAVKDAQAVEAAQAAAKAAAEQAPQSEKDAAIAKALKRRTGGPFAGFPTYGAYHAWFDAKTSELQKRWNSQDNRASNRKIAAAYKAAEAAKTQAAQVAQDQAQAVKAAQAKADQAVKDAQAQVQAAEAAQAQVQAAEAAQVVEYGLSPGEARARVGTADAAANTALVDPAVQAAQAQATQDSMVLDFLESKDIDTDAMSLDDSYAEYNRLAAASQVQDDQAGPVVEYGLSPGEARARVGTADAAANTALVDPAVQAAQAQATQDSMVLDFLESKDIDTDAMSLDDSYAEYNRLAAASQVQDDQAGPVVEYGLSPGEARARVGTADAAANTALVDPAVQAAQAQATQDSMVLDFLESKDIDTDAMSLDDSYAEYNRLAAASQVQDDQAGPVVEYGLSPGEARARVGTADAAANTALVDPAVQAAQAQATQDSMVLDFLESKDIDTDAMSLDDSYAEYNRLAAASQVQDDQAGPVVEYGLSPGEARARVGTADAAANTALVDPAVQAAQAQATQDSMVLDFLESKDIDTDAMSLDDSYAEYNRLAAASQVQDDQAARKELTAYLGDRVDPEFLKTASIEDLAHAADFQSTSDGIKSRKELTAYLGDRVDPEFLKTASIEDLAHAADFQSTSDGIKSRKELTAYLGDRVDPEFLKTASIEDLAHAADFQSTSDGIKSRKELTAYLGDRVDPEFLKTASTEDLAHAAERLQRLQGITSALDDDEDADTLEAHGRDFRAIPISYNTDPTREPTQLTLDGPFDAKLFDDAMMEHRLNKHLWTPGLTAKEAEPLNNLFRYAVLHGEHDKAANVARAMDRMQQHNPQHGWAFLASALPLVLSAPVTLPTAAASAGGLGIRSALPWVRPLLGLAKPSVISGGIGSGIASTVAVVAPEADEKWFESRDVFTKDDFGKAARAAPGGFIEGVGGYLGGRALVSGVSKYGGKTVRNISTKAVPRIAGETAGGAGFDTVYALRPDEQGRIGITANEALWDIGLGAVASPSLEIAGAGVRSVARHVPPVARVGDAAGLVGAVATKRVWTPSALVNKPLRFPGELFTTSTKPEAVRIREAEQKIDDWMQDLRHEHPEHYQRILELTGGKKPTLQDMRLGPALRSNVDVAAMLEAREVLSRGIASGDGASYDIPNSDLVIEANPTPFLRQRPKNVGTHATDDVSWMLEGGKLKALPGKGVANLGSFLFPGGGITDTLSRSYDPRYTTDRADKLSGLVERDLTSTIITPKVSIQGDPGMIDLDAVAKLPRQGPILPADHTPRSDKRHRSSIIIEDPSGQILLVKGKGDPLWGLPGGGVDGGESAGIAAGREVREETGFDVQDIQGQFNYDSPTTYHSVFRGKVDDPTAAAELQAKEIEDIMWWNPDEPLDIMPSTRDIVEGHTGKRPDKVPEKRGRPSEIPFTDTQDWRPRTYSMAEIELIDAIARSRGAIDPGRSVPLSGLHGTDARYYIESDAPPITRSQILRGGVRHLAEEMELRPKSGLTIRNKETGEIIDSESLTSSLDTATESNGGIERLVRQGHIDAQASLPTQRATLIRLARQGNVDARQALMSMYGIDVRATNRFKGPDGTADDPMLNALSGRNARDAYSSRNDVSRLGRGLPVLSRAQSEDPLADRLDGRTGTMSDARMLRDAQVSGRGASVEPPEIGDGVRPPVEPPEIGDGVRPPVEPPEIGDGVRPPVEPPEIGDGVRPPVEPPEIGDGVRPPVEPPEIGDGVRPPVEPPEIGDGVRPPVEPPEIGDGVRPPVEPPEIGDGVRPPVEPPEIGDGIRPPVEPPEIGDGIRGLVEPPEIGDGVRPPVEPPEIGDGVRPPVEPPPYDGVRPPVEPPPDDGILPPVEPPPDDGILPPVEPPGPDDGILPPVEPPGPDDGIRPPVEPPDPPPR